MKLFVVSISIMVCLFTGCDSLSNDGGELLGDDINIFADTPVWEAAKLIAQGDTSKVRSFFVDNPKLINYQEPKFGQSLLNWAVYANHYSGVLVLSDLGADPNLKENDGTTAFINAADKLETSDYLSLLLGKGGDVNFVVNHKERERIATPLIAAAWCRLESVKLLVEAGADVNYYWSLGEQSYNTALYSAFRGGKVEIIKYLIVDAGADFRRALSHTIHGESTYVVDELRYLPYPLESEEYVMKMEIVDFLGKNGIDYRATPIPQRYYKLYDSAYLARY